MSELLEVAGLTRAFGGLFAARDVAFKVADGEVVGLIGPNGAGKTTVFNMIAGLLKPTSGQVLLGGRDCTGLQPHRMAQLGVARTFQITSLFPTLTVMDNIRVGMHRRMVGSVVGALLGTAAYRREEESARSKARDILDFLGMSGLSDREAQFLSYGDQRRLELAIALAAEPKLLLLDEPAAGMSPDESRRLIELIGKIRQTGVSVLLVEHHMKVVMGVCDRIAVLDHGVVIAQGQPHEVANDPTVIRVYLGRETANA
ncbi:ABC transporter ATP-binding protein [Microbaculum marinisediminis]|uniref:ABC transporter ATP-binding protein n=1 Tax=Microbaculum marinisediminis TaxID=2931392 RepID=A0AAW5R5Y1_9HYPH|nr:ABC transporter ATP-binding protein [Microbaculum sp. A6E488]MCT8974318.1 ABC transporter ATP-binding protein [Microbaculum sp. A6E488]